MVAELVHLYANTEQVLQRGEVDVPGHHRHRQGIARHRRSGVTVQPRAAIAGLSWVITGPKVQSLGAKPAVAIVRRRLRGLGVARLPRRPQPGTLTNPAGLTDRQLEILRLVATGLSNAEIAQRLVVSPRAVDHHVSAVLQKLGVPTRRAAAWAADLESKPDAE